jgi:ADP-heptose:LPS heptosyltransferase
MNKWLDLIRRYLESGELVVLTGAGTADSQLVTRILDGFEPRGAAVNLVNRTSCGDLAAIVEKAQLVISPDTGIAHIAFAHRIPSVTLFGADSEVLWGHETPINLPLRAPVRYRSGGVEGGSGSADSTDSIRSITVDQVCSAAAMVLRAASQSARSIL